MDEKKINKDFNSLVKFRLSVFITVIILMVIVAPLYWVFIFSKKRKAKPIIKSNTVTGAPANANAPLLSAGDLDDNQASNGYSFSSLGQPCTNSSQKGGVANLPGAFTLQACDSQAGLQCVEGVFEGSVCLSQIGFFCDSVNDCVPEADACFNNVCSRQGDTLNQRCVSDGDCQILIDYNESNAQPKIYNHICQKEKGKNFGYCKVNLYPYDNGCNSNSDCAEGVECVNQIGKFNVTIVKVSDTISIFQFKDVLEWGNINDLVTQVFDNNNKSQGIYQIYDFNTTTNSGRLQPTSTTQTGNLSDGNYTISLGQANKGICLKKITQGGPANLTLGGVNIPCEDGTTNVKNFCLASGSPNIGDICVNGIVNCPSQTVDNYTVRPECLYNDNTEQGIFNDYYFGLSSGAFAEYKLGNCTVPTVGKEQLCDNLWNGCSGPYICIQETSQNGTPVSICNVPFQAQICFNDKCPENYSCGNPNDRPPLCLGKKEAFCIENGDCVSDQCSNYSIKVFDPASSKIINTFPISLPALANDNIKLNLYQPVLDANVFPYSKDLVVPEIKLFWFKTENNKYGVTIIDKNNTTKTIYINVPTNYEIKDIIMDEDENFLILYKRPVIDTMRQRSFPIRSISVNEFELPTYNGLVNEIKVYYVNTGSGANMVPTNQIYTLNKLSSSPSSNFKLKNKEGVEVTLNSSINYNNQHFIVTYDNKYAIQESITDTDRPYLLRPSYDFTNKTIDDQLKNGDEIYYHKVDVNDTILYGSSIVTEPNSPSFIPKQNILSENKSYYATAIGTALDGNTGKRDNWVFNTGITPTEMINYIISDDYYHSVGGYPILNDYKVINQYVNNANNGNYFSLNSKGFYTYGITVFDPDTYIDNQTVNFKDDFDYIYNQTINRYDINGNNHGLTYLYNNLDDNIKINSKKIDNKNYLIINKGLCYSPEYDNSRYVNQFIQLEYDINRDSDTLNDNYSGNNFENTLITNFGTSRTIFSYDIVKNIAQNQSKGFYYRDIKNGENNIDYININNNDSLFYTLSNNNSLNNKTENSLAINSKYEEIAFTKNTENQPELNYSDFSNFENLQPLEFSNLVSSTERKNNENYFIDENNFIYIYNETDINNILNFSSSELVLTKESTPVNINKTITATGAAIDDKSTINFSSPPQITWCLVNIVEYDVDINYEYLKIKIQVPIDYASIKDIIQDQNYKWFLHVYNFIPLQYYYIAPSSVVDTDCFNYQINDASLLFTGSKGNFFYTDNKYNLTRTGYNNIMIKTSSKNEGNNNTLPLAGNTYSIYTINDGTGVDLVNTSPGTSFYADASSYQYTTDDPTSFYFMNANVSFYDRNLPYTELLKVNTIRPDRIPYQYYFVSYSGSMPGFEMIAMSQSPFPNTNYVTISDTSDVNLNNFNSFSNGRFFLSFVPLTNNQLNNLFRLSFLEQAKQIPMCDSTTSDFPIPFTNSEADNKFNQFALDLSGLDSIKIDGKIIRRKYGGTISLPYSNYSDKLYTVNQLFASSLPLGDTFFINSSPVKKDFIIPTVAYDKDGNIIIKNLGNIPLYQTHMAHYQTGTNKNADYFNQTNQVAISFPKWLKARYVSRANQIPKIRKIIINNNEGNNYANATYYAFIEYIEDGIGKTNLVYLDAENTNFDLAQNQGVPTSKSIFEDRDKLLEVINGFNMTGTDKLLYILSKSCN